MWAGLQLEPSKREPAQWLLLQRLTCGLGFNSSLENVSLHSGFFVSASHVDWASTLGSHGDVISGFTWNRIAELSVLPWFGRVQSGATPIDGVSRGRNDGPWRAVEHLSFPLDFLSELAEHWLKVRS